MKSLELSLFADYSQFYIQDESTADELSAEWTPETVSYTHLTLPTN